MTLPASGPISASAINTEYGRASNSNLPLGVDWVRAYVGKASGPISYADFRGRSSYTPMSGRGEGDSYYGNYSGYQNPYTLTLRPYVTIYGGSGGFTYLWEFDGPSYGFTIAIGNTAQAAVQVGVGKFGVEASCRLKCTVKDGTGRTFVITGIPCEASITDGNNM